MKCKPCSDYNEIKLCLDPEGVLLDPSEVSPIIRVSLITVCSIIE